MEEQKRQKKKGNLGLWVGLMFFVLLLVAVVLILWFLMRGQTTTTGDWQEDERAEFLNCEAEGVSYPIFAYDGSDRKILKINAVFNNDKLSTISLDYKLYYSGPNEVSASEARNHAAMNLSSQEAGLGPDIFNAHYTQFSDALEMILYAKASEITNVSSRYLMLDWIGNNKYTKVDVQENYTSKGLNCVANVE